MIVPHVFYHLDLTRKIMSKIDEAKEEEKVLSKSPSKVINSKIITIINLKQTPSAKNLLQIVIGMYSFIYFH